ncbi:MAG: glycosyltransferase N-terminal domain-containing protein [Candidatus Hydrogenedentes bacterium]|nr:glycosyltransferase N-terminal domain-containing protein [Candidatus Hydrogenedentota bacterium]
MNQLLYDIASTAAAPAAAAWIAISPRHRALLARFSPPAQTFPESPIWVHACSVGELGVARPIIAGLHERRPGVPLLLTVSTRSAWDMANGLALPATLCWFPFDQRAVVARFFDRVQPRLLALMETEIWPNVLREAQRREVPALVLNGRISDKHLARYQRFAGFFRTVFSRLTGAGVQRSAYAERFAALGLDPDRITVTGNIKFDNLTTAVDPETLRALRVACGIPENAFVIVFGSTRPGDEILAAGCWREWKQAHPNAYLIVAPRHQNRLADALAPFDEPVMRRSRMAAGQAPAGERIVFLDTLGELTAFYALATVAVVGGSFYPGVNGHNPLEPAALRIPTVFGPYMSNFPGPAEALLAENAAIQVSSPDGLTAAVAELLHDPGRRLSLAQSAQRAIAANQGALARSLDLIDAALLKSGHNR